MIRGRNLGLLNIFIYLFISLKKKYLFIFYNVGKFASLDIYLLNFKINIPKAYYLTLV